MTLAFYAPMKSPNHAVPSGDRTIARNLMAALKHAGFEVELTSQLCSRDGRGDEATQSAIMRDAESEVSRLIEQASRRGKWAAWITYHNYYKAPDLIGPRVASALNIPYLQIESTRARKRLSGPWAKFAEAAETSADAADAILYFTHRDAQTLERDAPKGQKLRHLHPFLNRKTLPPRATGSHILSVGMMREGDKLSSYEIIAQTLPQLKKAQWHLDIVGDGPARSAVQDCMAAFGQRVTFWGEVSPTDMDLRYQNAAVLFWPGVNEAFGMTYLEAQAAGLAVVAQDRPGVQEILTPNSCPTPQAGVMPLAQTLDQYLSDTEMRKTAAQTNIDRIAGQHLLPSAAATLTAALADLGVNP